MQTLTPKGRFQRGVKKIIALQRLESGKQIHFIGHINKLQIKRRFAFDRSPHALVNSDRKDSIEEQALELATRKLTLKLIKFASNPSEKEKVDQM